MEKRNNKDYFYEKYRMADFYDDHYSGVVHDIPFWVNEASGSDRILEIACGTGRITTKLLEIGKEVVAVDYSREMLEQFVEKHGNHPGVKLVEADMRSMKLHEKFDLIYITSNSLNHIETNMDLEKTLKNMHMHLNDGGCLIFDVLNPKFQFLMRDPAKRHDEGVYRHTKTGGYFKTWENNVYDYKTQINEVKYFYQFCDEKGKEIDENITKMKMNVRLFYPAEMDYIIEKSDFKILGKYDWFDKREWKGETGEQIYILQKK